MTQVSAFGVNGNGTTGPASSASFGAGFVAGLAFDVTTSGNFLYGYYIWRADSSQPASTSFALWQITGATTGTFVTGSSASSSSLVVGQWNFVALGTPLALTASTPYKAVYGLTGNFPDTKNAFNGGGTWPGGIVNSPLNVYSAIVGNGGTNPEPNGTVQGSFGTSGADPTVNYPTSDDVESNFWIDVLVGPSLGNTGSVALAPMGMSASVSVPPAVYNSGTPQNVHATAGSVTGAWPTGSSQVTGNLLVAIVTSAAATSTAALNTPSGWTKQIEEGNSATAHARAVVYTKTAAGGDTAPTFTSTLSGTGGMNCMLFELVGADTTTVIDTSGVFASGSTSGTLASTTFTVTTAGNPSAAGGYAIAVFSQERAAANLTFTDSGTGWTKLLNGAGVSSVAQAAVLAQPAVPAGSTLNDNGQFSTDTTAFGAAVVAVFKLASVSTTSTGSIALAPMALGGSAAVTGGSVALAPMALSGPALQTNTSTGSVALAAMALSGGHTSYRLMDGASGRPGVGSSTMTPPTSPTGSGTGSFQAGCAFAVTSPGMWFEGYWWFVPTGGDTGSQDFCLYQVGGSQVNAQDPVLVAGTTVSSGTLTANSWNFTALAAPVPLSTGRLTAEFGGGGGVYVATTAWTSVHGFPDTPNAFGSGDPYANGIANGPLMSGGYFGGTRPPSLYGPTAGQVFGTATSNPAAGCPVATDGGFDNFWIDVQVGTPGPGDYPGSYRLYPNRYDTNDATTNDSSVNYVVATEVHLSTTCTTNRIWYYSPDGTTQLATRASVYTITGANSGTEVVAVTSPSWKAPDGSAATAGTGWVYCDAGEASLGSGHYKVAVYNSAGTPDGWSAKDATSAYWDTGEGTGGTGFGPIAAPDLASSSLAYEYNGNAGGTPPFSNGTTEPGQCTFAESGPAYPYLYVDALAQNYWVDLEVSLPASGSVALAPMAMSGTASVTTGDAATGSVAVAPMAIAATAGQPVTATGSVALAPMALNGAAGQQETAAGSIALAPMALSGTGAAGAVPVTAAGSVALAPMAEAASGVVVAAGSGFGSVALAPMALAGAAGQAESCTGSVTLAPMALAGAQPSPVTSTAALALAAMRITAGSRPVPARSAASVFAADTSVSAVTRPRAGTATVTGASSASSVS